MKYLSRKDIEIIGNRVIQAYMRLPDFVGKTIYRITPDVLIRDVLGLNLEYHHLSLDGSVLGLTRDTTTFDYDSGLIEQEYPEIALSLLPETRRGKRL